MEIVLVLDRQNGLSAQDFGALSALKGLVGVDFETASGQHQRSVAAVVRVAEPFDSTLVRGQRR